MTGDCSTVIPNAARGVFPRRNGVEPLLPGTAGTPNLLTLLHLSDGGLRRAEAPRTSNAGAFPARWFGPDDFRAGPLKRAATMPLRPSGLRASGCEPL